MFFSNISFRVVVNCFVFAGCSYGSEKIGQGKDNAKLFLKEHPDKAKDIENKIREIALSKNKPNSEIDQVTVVEVDDEDESE